ncbi:MAG: glycosyltransferase [Solirubrobacterales bacterium]
MKPTVEIAIPVYNEERALEAGVRRLHGYLAASFPYSFRIVIADNASDDATPAICRRLSAEIPAVTCVRLTEKGRGRALRRVWSTSDAEVVAYMDVDLSTDLAALLPLVAPLVSGHSDLAIGSRLANGSRVVRGPKRELISRAYNRLLRLALRTRFSDAQCGFKAGRAETIRALLPAVEDEAWFFDTELLTLAERRGLRIHEVPVDWVDDPDSSVAILRTAIDDLLGVLRLYGELMRFALVGVASTLLYFLLFLGLRALLPALAANAAALALSAVANTAANRRFTFGRRGGEDLVRHHAQGLLVFGLCLALTSGSLLALETLAPAAPRGLELGVLFAANALATALRYLLLRLWVFGPGRQRGLGGGPQADGDLQGWAPCPPLPSQVPPSPAPTPRA